METATAVKAVGESLKPIALAEIVTKLALGAKYGEVDGEVHVGYEGDVVRMHKKDFEIATRAALRIKSKIPQKVSPGALIRLVGDAQRAVSEEIFLPGAIRVLYYATLSKVSAFYRCLMPMYALNMGGKAVAHASATRYGREALDYDIVVLQIDNSPSALAFMKALQSQGKKVVYEIDDAFDCLEPWHPQYGSYSQKERQEGVQAMLRQADAIQTSTRWLQARYTPPGKPSEVVRNMIELATWPRADRLRKDGKWKVVWAGSPSHAGDLETVIPALAAFAKAHPDVTIVFFGQTVNDDRIPKGQVENLPWCEFEDYPNKLAEIDADIAIAPLTNVPFNLGKSNLRILQYWATGYPVLASEVGSYAATVAPNYNGVPCTTTESWLASLEMTYRNEAVCKRLVAGGFESVKAYDVLANSEKIQEFYASLVR